MNQRLSFRQRAIAYFKACLCVCFAVLFCCSSFAIPAMANEDVDDFGFVEVPAPDTNFVNVPFADPCGSDDFTACPGTPVTTETIDINFGTGDDRILESIEVGPQTFIPASDLLPNNNGLVDTIVFRRRNAATIPSAPGAPDLTGDRSQLFFEYDGPPNNVSGPLNIVTQEVDSAEEAILNTVINRGIDNVFNNVSTEDYAGGGNIEETRNNIERVDFLINNGVTVPVANRDNVGFLVLDRGGNDPFGIAAILDIDSPVNPTPTRYGPLSTQPDAAWGGLGEAGTIRTVFTRDDDPLTPAPPGQPPFLPSHTVGNLQPVKGRFFRLSDLIPPTDPSTRIFGYSLFPGDVAGFSEAALLDFANLPADTNSDAGGLDLIAGGLVLAVEPNAQIGAAKTNSAPRPVDGQPGFFDFDLELRVTNTGNTVLNNVQLTEDLEAAFINNTATNPPLANFNPANSITVVGTPTIDASGVTGTAPTINPAYTGATAAPSPPGVPPGTSDLFAIGNSFNPGDTAVVTVTARVELGTLGGATPALDGILVANNQAQAAGESPGGQVPDDRSQDGRDVDPDNDGNPGNNNDPTLLQIPFPSIGVAKAVSPFRPVAGTTQFDFDFTFTVTNAGATNLDGVTLQEPLGEALITNATNRADAFTVLGTPTITPAAGFSGTLPTVNAAYNGEGNNTVFTGGTLNPGDSLTAVITVRADLGSGGPGPINDGVLIAENTATAMGTPSGPGVPPGTGPVMDQSQVGTNADPDGDGNPGNNNQPTPVQFPSGINDLVLVKRITNIFRGGAALPIQGITNFNDQPTDSNDAALNAALGGGNQLAGIFQLPAGLALQPNDEVEYTIYLWNSSGGSITQLNICDELQPPSVLNTAVGFELDPIGPLGSPTFGNAGALVEGRSPGAPLDGFCPSAPGSFPLGPPGPTGGLGVGAGGGVVAGPFNVPSNQFGAFRFRVRIP